MHVHCSIAAVCCFDDEFNTLEKKLGNYHVSYIYIAVTIEGIILVDICEFVAAVLVENEYFSFIIL